MDVQQEMQRAERAAQGCARAMTAELRAIVQQHGVESALDERMFAVFEECMSTAFFQGYLAALRQEVRQAIADTIDEAMKQSGVKQKEQ